MLYFIAVWTLLSIVCWLTGTALLNSLKANIFVRLGDRSIISLWLGVVFLSIALLATSFIFALSSWVGGLVATILGFLSLLSPKVRCEIAILRSHLTPSVLVGILTLSIGVAALTTRQVTWIDTGLYHYGAIRWLSEFGAVPGIALLSKQLGFASAWFALAAPLNAVFLEGRASAVTNGFVIFLASLHCIVCLTQGFAKKSKISDWFIVFFLFIVISGSVATRLLSTVLISPSPDIPVIFLTGVVAWVILVSSDSINSTQLKHPVLYADLIPLILAIGATSIKLTALPLLFVTSLVYLFGRRFSSRRFLVGSVVSILLLLPILFFGATNSGCLLYPSPLLCLDVPWAITSHEAQALGEVTRGWGSWFGSPPSQANSSLWLFWQWFNSISSSKLIVLLVGISIASTGYVIKESRAKQNFSYCWILILAFVGSAFTLSQAPLLRFGIGYFVLLPTLLAALLFQSQLQVSLARITNQPLSSWQLKELQHQSLFISLLLAAMVGTSLTSQGVRSRLLLPPQVVQVEVVEKQINDVTYFSPKNQKGACWAAELPCTNQPDRAIRLRNPEHGVQAGFSRQL
ncbi:hypothetical protein H6F93_18010 [Leptolyngbya sp. FACHB-671]|uniref:LIC_10190 family membrane protein n=1 Tax=Leptolyngbya sp. FACHB-671 TaxID=2692812 RepID=UPI00168438A3|nr:hypothetical protein [Leptolyngbya sp. FACHB-671]MBD2069392.1 hypothetical protein [Leptolyngbya sp. FACHB-671]